jgi:hypothetical protein
MRLMRSSGAWMLLLIALFVVAIGVLWVATTKCYSANGSADSVREVPCDWWLLGT